MSQTRAPADTSHTEEDLPDLMEPISPGRCQREPVTAPTLSVLLGTSLVRLGTGAASLIAPQQRYSSLRLSLEEDRETLENSISHPQDSLSSPAEVVTQNRRRRDLIFLKGKKVMCRPR